MDEITLHHYNHPRINGVVLTYPIGSIVDDQKIIDYQYFPKVGMRAIVQCQRCNRTKYMSKGCLDTHCGTTHMACGQFLKMKDPIFHRKWCGMKSRIYNENYWAFQHYGGRGLTCDYDVFVDFYDDMYVSYLEHRAIYGDDTSIDRIDINKGYVRGNLRWVTQKEQVNNSTKMGAPFEAISPEGAVFYGTNQRDFAEEYGLSAKQINAVLIGRYPNTHGWVFTYISPEDYFLLTGNIVQLYHE